MLGRDHALSGALAFAALGPSLHVTGSHLAAGVLLTAGAGTLPDIDHPDSTISRKFGFLTGAFAWLVDRLSGGHRHGTHSLVGIAVFSAGTLAAGSYQLTAHLTGHTVFSWHLVPAALYLALLYSAALRALHIGGHHGDLLGISGAIITATPAARGGAVRGRLARHRPPAAARWRQAIRLARGQLTVQETVGFSRRRPGTVESRGERDRELAPRTDMFVSKMST